jgi:hypothetical protein
MKSKCCNAEVGNIMDGKWIRSNICLRCNKSIALSEPTVAEKEAVRKEYCRTYVTEGGDRACIECGVTEQVLQQAKEEGAREVLEGLKKSYELAYECSHKYQFEVLKMELEGKLKKLQKPFG